MIWILFRNAGVRDGAASQGQCPVRSDVRPTLQGVALARGSREHALQWKCTLEHLTVNGQNAGADVLKPPWEGAYT